MGKKAGPFAEEKFGVGSGYNRNFQLLLYV
jgi:hypothetical protein